MRQIALEVHCVFLTIRRMVQKSISIVEDVPLGDTIIAVVRLKRCQCPIGDVLLSVGAVFVVDVKRKALRITREVEIWNYINHQSVKRLGCPWGPNTNHPIFRFNFGCWENSVLLVTPLIPEVIKVKILLAKRTIQRCAKVSFLVAA